MLGLADAGRYVARSRMTAQAPDHLLNRVANVDFGELALYGVIRGDVTANHGWGERYVFETEPSLPYKNKMCPALWRGYIAEFTIAIDGAITLDAYLFPFAPNKPRQRVHERLFGDFWLVMKSTFEGNRVYVPFRAGVVNENEDEWVIEGNDSLDALKRPKREQRFEPKNVPIDNPVFVGIVKRVTFDELLEGFPKITLDRDLPRIHYWCEMQIHRDGRVIADTKICGSSGGASGPWMLRPPFEPMIDIGDHVFAVSRLPNDCEIKEQMTKEAT